MEKQHNLEKEKRLLEWLGYSMVGPDGSNRWQIFDDNQNQVGYIQYKKLHNGNSKKGHVKVFGYKTYINSSNIFCEFSREENDKNGNILDGTDDGFYSFDLKRGGQETDHVKIDILDYPSLTMWSKKYGFIDFKIDDRGLFLNFKSKTDNYNIEEVLVYKNFDDGYHGDKEYVYQIKYFSKDVELSIADPKKRTTKEISGTQRYYGENQLEISEKIWVDGKLKSKKDSLGEETVEEMAIKHQLGIDCFNRFRCFINQIIPFKEDVVSIVVNEDNVKQYNLPIFFPEYNESILETPVKKELTPSKK